MRMNRRITWLGGAALLIALAGCSYLFNQPPVAAFDPEFNTVEGEPLVVVLDASASVDPDGDPIVEYAWTVSKEGGDIGEGLVYYPEGWTTTTTTEPIITVRFPVQGTYTMQLLVRSDRGGVLDSSPVVSETFVLPNEQHGPTL
jgi:hypothetical protein